MRFCGAAHQQNLVFKQVEIVHYDRYDGSTVVYKPSQSVIIIRNIIGLIRLRLSGK